MSNGPMKKCSTYLITTKKIQIKSTMSSYLIPEAQLPSRRRESTETGSERNAYTLLVDMLIGPTTMGNSMKIRQKIKNRPTMKWSEVTLLSCARLFATPWTVVYKAPLSMEFSRQECWSGLPFPSPGDLPDPGIEPRSPALRADTLPSEPPGIQQFHS